MSKIVKLKKGFDLKLVGKAPLELIQVAAATTFADSKDPSIRRFLGIDEKLGEDMGLPNDFAQRVLKQVGNYGEIYDREIGKPLQLDRGLNNLWTKGGLLYSPPFR